MDQKQLEQLFTSHPSVDVFHITSNGYAFAKKDHALDHAKSLKDHEVKEVHRSDVFKTKGESEQKPAPANEVIEAIKAAKSLEELEAALPDDENRKSVLAAYEKRKGEQWPDSEDYN